MERFRPALRRVAAELDLPRGARTELLLELAADLQAVYEHYRARGLREDEAAVRAEATVLGSTEVIRRLGRLHLSPWRGWAEEMSGTLRGVHAVVLVSVGVLPVVATAVGVSVWVLAHRASPFAWSILVVCALVTAVAAKDALRILRDRPGHRGYAQRLLLLAAMAPALGLLAPIFGLQRAVAAFDDRAPEEALLLESLAPELATLLAGLFVGIAGLLVWFVLIELEARRSAREVDALFAHDVPPAVVPGATDAGGSVIPLVRRRQG
jgi:hypothetical protein